MSLEIDLEIKRKDFNLSVHTKLHDDGFTAIYGHSGAGKTTLLRWIAGLEKITEGQLYFKQQCWQSKNSYLPTQKRQIAYVFQEARLFPHLTVEENLLYAYKRRFTENGPSLEQVCEWFELQTLLIHPSTDLSGGQQQRVAIARSLLSNPQLILMDEPLASLDNQSKQYIIQHLEKLYNHLRIPVLYISHDIAEVSRLANQLLLLEQGRIRAQGSILELSSRLDLSLSHEENAASILNAIVVQHDKQYHLTELTIPDSPLEKHSLFITKNNTIPGDNIQLRIPARDVSISLKKATDSSILNILHCTVDAIEDTQHSRVLVRLKLANQWLLARLTYKSVHRLQLSIGQTVYAQIKTVALLNDQPSNSSSIKA